MQALLNAAFIAILVCFPAWSQGYQPADEYLKRLDRYLDAISKLDGVSATQRDLIAEFGSQFDNEIRRLRKEFVAASAPLAEENQRLHDIDPDRSWQSIAKSTGWNEAWESHYEALERASYHFATSLKSVLSEEHYEAWVALEGEIQRSGVFDRIAGYPPRSIPKLEMLTRTFGEPSEPIRNVLMEYRAQIVPLVSEIDRLNNLDPDSANFLEAAHKVLELTHRIRVRTYRAADQIETLLGSEHRAEFRNVFDATEFPWLFKDTPADLLYDCLTSLVELDQPTSQELQAIHEQYLARITSIRQQIVPQMRTLPANGIDDIFPEASPATQSLLEQYIDTVIRTCELYGRWSDSGVLPDRDARRVVPLLWSEFNASARINK
ncbi:MAG: hypothetical protein ACR2GY_06575 [Phycisphaerales bacterium]